MVAIPAAGGSRSDTEVVHDYQPLVSCVSATGSHHGGPDIQMKNTNRHRIGYVKENAPEATVSINYSYVMGTVRVVPRLQVGMAVDSPYPLVRRVSHSVRKSFAWRLPFVESAAKVRYRYLTLHRYSIKRNQSLGVPLSEAIQCFLERYLRGGSA